MTNRIDIEKLKAIAAEDNERPEVSTMDPQVRTSKYALFPEPKDMSALEDES
ncbi:hypothetical protein [Streptomyces sp. NPDC001851]|uniref:hypothetical protein n=1 Tax=Streptomyces sp. NPDC001851 TaxID=3154529 RepID=UPI00331A842D